MARSGYRWTVWKTLLTAGALVSGVLGDDILSTNGFTNCMDNSDIKVERVDITYNNSNKTVNFNVAGSSTGEQRVKAVLSVTAYGNPIYENEFDPCDDSTFVSQLCPVPEGRFSAWGSQQIPEEFADVVPGIAFQFPDIAAQATLELRDRDGGQNVACIQSQVTNGRTASLPAVSYVAAGIAGAALIASGLSAIASAVGGGAAGGAGSASPGFTEVVSWFQGLAMNGMLSVNYPPIYRSFTKNFAFSTGIISWGQLQTSIDDFRSSTGGNLTADSFEFLQNATLVFADNSTVTPAQTFRRRAAQQFAHLMARQFDFGSGGSEETDGEAEDSTQIQQVASGIQAYVEQLAVPKSNVFMNVLLVVAIIVAIIVVGILLTKLVLEFWALFGNFPKSLAGFRKHYWGTMARSITSLVLVLYGVWVLYCVFQFTNGDSWAAQTLAGVTLAIFTGILAFFSWKIYTTARKLKDAEGDASALYEDKSIWIKYSLFYEAYRKNYWWLFIPFIIYMLLKGIAIAALDSQGMVQTIIVLAIEASLLILLLWSRPFERRSGNVINIIIQVVRVLSMVCILVFVEEFGIEQTTQTITGIVLIVVQSTLTGILAILIAWNAINACCKANPHRQRRKEMEKLQRDMDTLTPLDARNSLLFTTGKPPVFAHTSISEKRSSRSASPDVYAVAEEGLRPALAPSGGPLYRPLTPSMPFDVNQSLVRGAAPLGAQDQARYAAYSPGGYRSY
ncbi:hypothetical protein S40288_10100 [Stachybotrys chartarum IBT 40288]|nr:hypothetical protein S40288_10100 [Stachybotrys chartarum IBT 40288]